MLNGDRFDSSSYSTSKMQSTSMNKETASVIDKDGLQSEEEGMDNS